jgi:hypothetical protein
MKRVAIAALVMLVVGMTALPVVAQTTIGQPLGWIYISANNTTYDPDIQIAPFTPISIYLMLNIDYGYINQAGLNSSVGPFSYEAAVVIPPVFTVTAALIRNKSLNLGSDRNLIVGLNPAILANTTPIDLVEYTIGAFTPGADLVDLEFSIAAATPSSFSPAVPGMADNTAFGECTFDGNPVKCLRPFAKISRAVSNCSADCVVPMPVEHNSWSALKGNFSN